MLPWAPQLLGHYFNVKAWLRHKKPVEMHQCHPHQLPLCALMVRPGGGAGGWSRCTGQRCPAPVPGRSCWPAVCQAALIQGVLHVHCPPRRPLSRWSGADFTLQEHHKDVAGVGRGNLRGMEICCLLLHPSHPIKPAPLFRFVSNHKKHKDNVH